MLFRFDQRQPFTRFGTLGLAKNSMEIFRYSNKLKIFFIFIWKIWSKNNRLQSGEHEAIIFNNKKWKCKIYLWSSKFRCIHYIKLFIRKYFTKYVRIVSILQFWSMKSRWKKFLKRVFEPQELFIEIQSKLIFRGYI